MYVCYSYSYPGASPATAAPVATLPPAAITAPTVAGPPITEPVLIPVTAPAQVFSPATIPIAVCRKRGSDELMSHNPMVTNGQGLSPGQEVNDAKKVKLDNAISRVLHLRNLPTDVNDTEVVQLGMPFGRMKNVLLLKQKNQGFLEFEDETAANTMVNYYQTCPAKIRDRVIYVQFSKHTELKTDHATSFQNATAQAALQAAQALIVGNGGGDEASKRTTLRVIVENLVYPVTIECLHQIFSKFGKVLKMIIFTKNNTFQALIQFGDSVSANAAKLSLDGQNIYNGCCTLRIDYSKLSNLNVKYNNDKSRDFTNPNLPSGDPSMDQAMHFGAGPGMGLAGNMPMTGFGIPNAAMNAAQARLLPGMAGAQMGSSVLLVSNLDEQKVNPDALFTLFGVYGDVHRVKILFNKKDNALIQMAEPHQAQLAIAHLDKLKLWGKSIRVTQSKHSQVQMPKDGQPDAGLTKDFVSSPLHRFKRPGSKNCQNIYPPSAVLHLSNIPPSVTEDQLTEGFSQHGDVKGFKFFAKDRKMALIQMGAVEEAVEALIAMHNYPLSDSNHLRVSFSKSTL